MAGIDNNTLLYLRGDSFNDLSLNNNTVTNVGIEIDEGKFGNGFKCNTNKYISINNNDNRFTFGSSDFTVDFFIKFNSFFANLGIFTPMGDTAWVNIIGSWHLIGHADKTITFDYYNTTSSIVSLKTKTLVENTWYHIALVVKDKVASLYIDGIKQGSLNLAVPLTGQSKILIAKHDGANQINLQGYLDEFRISDVARYTEDFTPPTQPFNSLTINVTCKDATKIDFNISKLGIETINKVQIYESGELKETYTEGYNNLTYLHNNQSVKIVVTYDDEYTEELDIQIGNSKAKIYLYKEGNECESLTGGWDIGLSESSYGLLTSSKESNCISSTYSSGDRIATLCTNNSLDLQFCHKIYADVDVTTGHSTNGVRKYKLFANSEGWIANSNVATSDLDSHFGLGRKSIELTPMEYNAKVGILMGYVTGFIHNIYLTTKENVLIIHSQTDDSVTFSINDLGLVTIDKIDVLVNEKLSQTYTDTYSNLTYTIDRSLTGIGNNKITIRAFYSQGDGIVEYAEEELDFFVQTPDKLPYPTNYGDIADRRNMLNNTVVIQKNILKDILIKKNINILKDENKLSTLIQKIDLLGVYNPNILYLYNKGDECVHATGGWFFIDTWEAGGVSREGIKNSDNLQVNVTYDCAGFMADTVDFTVYNKLKVEYEIIKNTDESELSIEIKDHYNYASPYLALLRTKEIKAGTLEIDISSITGVHKLSCESYTGQTTTGELSFKIYKVWLEK